MRVTLAVLLTVAGCATPFAPQGARPFTPPDDFVGWWSDVEQCAGRAGDWRRIEWWVAPDPEMMLRGERQLAVWQPPHTVYLSSEVVSHTDGRPPWQPWAVLVVKHEMLHDLTGPDHGPVFDACGVRDLR